MQAARDLPFPRLSAYAFWAYFVGGLVFFGTIFFGLSPNGGWFMYPPLTSTKYSPAENADWWLLGIGFIEISAIAGAIEIIVGVMKTRAVGMSLDKLPVYSWAMLVFAVMIVIGFPAIILGTLLLEMERAFDWPFFIAERGGDPLLWQHLFWFFGHPEVYIIFLPATGMVSMIVPTMAQTPLVGYRLVVLALIATGFLSFGLWVHHMFAHVRHGSAEDVPRLLLGRQHGGGGAERHPGLRLDRHHRLRAHEADDAVAVHHRLPVRLHPGWADGRHGRHGAVRLAGS
jgi:cytochrome c oxidase subunit I+III